MKDLLVIVPSRSRPETVEQLAQDFFFYGRGKADLMFATDDDQPRYPFCQEHPEILFRVGPRLRMCGTLNEAAVESAGEYKYLGFMGDDHRPRTHRWDEEIIEALERHPIAYGNDLIWGEELPTAVFMRSDIVKKLGYMAPPELIHLYLDNFWLTLGKRIGIEYLPHVTIEHLHPSVGKSNWTPEYAEVNDPTLYAADEAAFNNYLTTRFESDLEKLND